IWLLGYPALFPVKAPSIFDIKTAECHLLFSAWDASERSSIRQWGVELNGMIQADAHAAEVDYVDIFPFFAQHEPCGPAGEWVRFVGLSSGSVRDGSFPPRKEWQAMMERIVSCY